ncbi:MAG: 4-(cytidine 5'-diphospho)-2-C-methyl-D-erythritol kinase [Actinomycetota bacterium]
MAEKKKLTVKSAGKINLYLNVSKNGRNDGYHNIKSIMQSISLADELSFEIVNTAHKIGDNIIITSDNEDIPLDEENLVYKAARILLNAYNIQYRYKVKINIKKSIPVSAGLAGGSTNAAATLLALNRLLELKISKPELLRLASEIGSDVPFCLAGGTALAEGRGEVISKLPDIPFYWVVLAKNGKKFQTKEVYDKFDHIGKEKNSVHSNLVEKIERGYYDSFLKKLYNDLEEVGLLEDITIQKIKETAKQLGAVAAQMTGSGPTVFAFCADLTAAQKVYKALKLMASQVFLTHTKTTSQSFI